MCDQWNAQQLDEALSPLPRPARSGAAALVLGGTFGRARTLAVDAKGRVLAYGYGRGATTDIAVCPGGRRLAELMSLEPGVAVAVRDARSLELIRQRRIRLPGDRFVSRFVPYGVVPGFPGRYGLACEDPAASRLLVFATDQGAPPRARLIRLAGRTTETLWRGIARFASFALPTVYLNTGAAAPRLVAFHVRTRRATFVSRLPRDTFPLVPSPDGRQLAGIVFNAPERGSSPRSRLVVVDLRGADPELRTAPLGATFVAGEAHWLPDGRLIFFPSTGNDTIRIYDQRLRLRSGYRRWSAYETAIVGSTAYGLEPGGRLTAVQVPTSELRFSRRLPSPVVLALTPASR